ncbi:MAG: hypothetical protein WDW38_005553 [Sanguina aurantia]
MAPYLSRSSREQPLALDPVTGLPMPGTAGPSLNVKNWQSQGTDITRELTGSERFQSLALHAEVKLTEALERAERVSPATMLNGEERPNKLRTAVCCQLLAEFAELCGPFGSVLRSIREELVKSVFSGYYASERGALVFDQLPWFSVAERLENEKEAAVGRIEEQLAAYQGATEAAQQDAAALRVKLQVLVAARETARLESRTGREELKRVRKETLRMRDELEAEAASHNQLKVTAAVRVREAEVCCSLSVQHQGVSSRHAAHTDGDGFDEGRPDRCHASSMAMPCAWLAGVTAGEFAGSAQVSVRDGESALGLRVLELRRQLLQADSDVADAQRLAAERLPPSVLDALRAELDASAAQIAQLMGLMVEQEREGRRKAMAMGACTPPAGLVVARQARGRGSAATTQETVARAATRLASYSSELAQQTAAMQLAHALLLPDPRPTLVQLSVAIESSAYFITEVRAAGDAAGGGGSATGLAEPLGLGADVPRCLRTNKPVTIELHDLAATEALVRRLWTAKHSSTCHGPDKSLQSYIFDHFNAATSAAAPKTPLSQSSGPASFRSRANAAPTNSAAAFGNLPDVAQQSYSLYHACATHSAASAAVRAFSGVLTGQLPETVLLQQQLQLAAVHAALHAIPRTTAPPPAGSSGVSATEPSSRSKRPSGGGESDVMVPTELALDLFAHLFPHRPAHKLSRLRDALRLDFPGGSVDLDGLMSSWAPFKGRAEVSPAPVSPLQPGSDIGAGPAGSGDTSPRTSRSDVSPRTETAVPSSGPSEAGGGAAATVPGRCGAQLRAALLEQHLEEVEASVAATAERLQRLCGVVSEGGTACSARADGGALPPAASPAVTSGSSSQVLLPAFERRLGGVVGVDAAEQALCHILGLHGDLSGCATKEGSGVGDARGAAAQGQAGLLRLLGGAGFTVTASHLVGKLLATLLLPGLQGPGVTQMMDLGAAVTWAGGLTLTQGGGVAEEGASSLPSLPSPA